MKKEKLIEILLVIVGGLTYSIGMCMYLIEKWDLKSFGLGAIIIGFLILLYIVPIHKKLKEGEEKRVINKKERNCILAGIVCFVIFAAGIIIMLKSDYDLTGTILVSIGFLSALLIYPIYNYKRIIDNLKNSLNDRDTYRRLLMIVCCILFAIGLPLTILEQFNLVIPGTIIGLIGAGLIILKLYLDSKEDERKNYYTIDVRKFIVLFWGIVGVFLIGYGFVKITEFENISRELLLGLLFIYIGFFLCAIPIPIYLYLKKNGISGKILTINIKEKKYSYSLRNLWLLFVIYGFLGWCVEFIVCGAFQGIFINRGFLHITLLPIWGLGGVIVTLIFSKSQRFVFIRSTLYLSFLEYITSLLLEIIFKHRWWEYYNEPFNLNGRICLMNCLAFGIFGFVFSKYVSPFINDKLNKENQKFLNCISIITLIIVATDFAISLFSPNMGAGITVF